MYDFSKNFENREAKHLSFSETTLKQFLDEVLDKIHEERIIFVLVMVVYIHYNSAMKTFSIYYNQVKRF